MKPFAIRRPDSIFLGFDTYIDAVKWANENETWPPQEPVLFTPHAQAGARTLIYVSIGPLWVPILIHGLDIHLIQQTL